MKLEKHLVLNKYFLNLFGFEDFLALKQKLESTKEGFDNGGRSAFADVLIGVAKKRIADEDILKYDGAIKGYAETLAANRRERITLKYFQYLAILFAETFLDRYFNHKPSFLSNLNGFVDEANKSAGREADGFSYFDEDRLKKMAYLMATGSGKTLIMHVNCWQFLKYNPAQLDNVILITPNEGMSKQHRNELEKSGIPCRLYAGNGAQRSLYQDEILVIDIHKLTQEKKGSGVRVEVESFEGNNLVFIDEGHKGQATEEKTWKTLREKLGHTGFIFEYSATFEQVIGPRDKDLLDEYSKAIIFDYSYKYFYGDGYGKDFYVYNLKGQSFQEKYRDLILTANLLSFYEQSKLYEHDKGALKDHLIEKPLWAFVGSKVSGAGLNSDVLVIVQFFQAAIEKKGFLEDNVEKVLQGKSGLTDKRGEDIFEDRLQWLKRHGYVISDIREELFNAKAGTLSLHEIKSADGEIALRVGDGDYFGVINIGDVSAFKKLLTASHIEIASDVIMPSIFERLGEHASSVNLIIGAKKFIEGWNSWRVCSMSLMNMGRGEGPQIIQLFGRGVRLKGKSLSLKRSHESDYSIKALETLNIFGLNADYMNTFLETLGREEVDFEEIPVPVRMMDDKERWNGLYMLQEPEGYDFTDTFLKLAVDNALLPKMRIDIRPKVSVAHGMEVGAALTEEEPVKLDEKYLSLLDWDAMYVELLQYKVVSGYPNLQIERDTLPHIISDGRYPLYAMPEQINPRTFAELAELHEIVLLVLKDYIDDFYHARKRQALTRELKPVFLAKDSKGFRDNVGDYLLKIPRSEEEHIKNIRQLLKQAGKLYQDDMKDLPRIHFDRHLYTPLLVYRKETQFIKSIPPQLNDGEARFVSRLRDYLRSNQPKFKGQEIFVLRNLSQRGVAFFQTRGYYPDFILWKRQGTTQTVAFVDPKGIRHLEDQKAQLHKDIKDIERKTGRKNIRFEAFIVSVTGFDELKSEYAYAARTKADFEKDHVLFMEDHDMLDKLFALI